MPPDDPEERDLAKRRHFIHELHAARIGSGFVDPNALKDGSIPETERLRLIRESAAIVSRILRPASPEAIRWQGLWGSEANPESPSGFDDRLLRVQAEWQTGEYVIRASRTPGYDRLSLLIRLPRRPELEFRPRPGEMEFDDEGFKSWEFVPTVEIGRLLFSIFQLDGSDFTIKGQLHTIDGVNVFKGELQPVGSVVAGDSGGSGGEVKYDLTGIMITESDPQYIGVGFDVSASSRIDSP